MDFKAVTKALAYVDNWVDYRDLGSLQWYIVGPPPQRDAAASTLKTAIDDKLTGAVAAKDILAYASEFVDVAATPDLLEYYHPVRRKIDSTRFRSRPGPQSSIYLPFFLNADANNNLGQELFDNLSPCVLCVSKKGFYLTTNPSKRETFRTLFVE